MSGIEVKSMTQIDLSPRPAKSALTATGGFLEGFTHTLQPYTGCRFGCDYCYVQGSPVHLVHKPRLPWGSYVHPRTGIAHHLAREMARYADKGKLGKLAIFMSSATDPYQGMERRHRLTRACLQVLAEYPPGLLIVQTRSPLVQDDFDLLRRIGERCWLNFTIETDLETVRKAVTPRCPSIDQRLAALTTALDMDQNVQIAVSPCLPYSSVETFGTLLIRHSHRVIVDTYTSGDGMAGKRTAKTAIPGLYQDYGWGVWSEEDPARSLFAWIRERIGERVGWSQDGFAALVRLMNVEQRPNEEYISS